MTECCVPASTEPKRWSDFIYREFHDVPRMILTSLNDQAYLLDSPFDEARDDYSPAYTIYEMPPLSTLDLSGSWEGLEKLALSVVGTCPVAHVDFDATRRAQIDLGMLHSLR
jgi:hypothetical protein